MSRYKSTNSSIKSHLSTGSQPKEEVNIVLLGKQFVGKSALIVKYLTKRFICEYDPFLEDTYWKPDVVDQQEVLVKVMDTYGKDDKRLPYYLKWADAVLITYSITQQDSFEMALAYLDSIRDYSKSISVSASDLVLILIGNKLDLERNRVITKSDGESTATKFNCTFCETTAADDYEYVQTLFHRTVREVRKERERVNNFVTTIEEETPAIVATTTSFPSPSSSSSSSSSIQLNSQSSPSNTKRPIVSPAAVVIPTPTIDTQQPPATPNIPVPPPLPIVLPKSTTTTTTISRQAKWPKPETQTSVTSSGSTSSTNNPKSNTTTVNHPPSASTPPSVSSATAKRTPSKTSSVFSKIFK